MSSGRIKESGPTGAGETFIRACLATTAPFSSPIQMTLFLRIQSGEKVTFTAETVVQRNGTVVAKQALIVFLDRAVVQIRPSVG